MMELISNIFPKILSRFVGELRKVENYHQNRHYVPRSGRVKGESQDAE